VVAAQLLITKPIDGNPATAANGGTIGIAAAIRYQGPRLAQGQQHHAWRHGDQELD
jgi:hypothetical protein